jgi:hypothetical protein
VGVLPRLVVEDERVEEAKDGVTGVEEGHDDNGVSTPQSFVQANDLRDRREDCEQERDQRRRVDQLGRVS